MFTSPTKAKLQEIGPKFTLKLRWLRKGLPGVLTADGVAPHAKNADQESEDEEEGDEEKGDETKQDVDMEAGEDAEGGPTEKKGKTKEKNVVNGVKIPALDEEQEYEWKWKVSAHFCDTLISADPYRISVEDGCKQTAVLLMIVWRCRRLQVSDSHQTLYDQLVL